MLARLLPKKELTDNLRYESLASDPTDAARGASSVVVPESGHSALSAS